MGFIGLFLRNLSLELTYTTQRKFQLQEVDKKLQWNNNRSNKIRDGQIQHKKFTVSKIFPFLSKYEDDSGIPDRSDKNNDETHNHTECGEVFKMKRRGWCYCCCGRYI